MSACGIKEDEMLNKVTIDFYGQELSIVSLTASSPGQRALCEIDYMAAARWEVKTTP